MIRFSLLVSFICVYQTVLFACSCSSLPPCQEFANHDAVFVGRITAGKRAHILPDKSGLDEIGTWQCEVVERFKGVPDKQVVLYTRNFSVGDGWCDHGFNYFEIGKTYLFYAYKSEGKLFTHIGFCSRTKLVAPFNETTIYRYDFRESSNNEIADDFSFLRNLDPQRRGSFQGMVLLDVGKSNEEKHLKEFKILLIGKHYKREAIPERDGYFYFDGLMPDEYELEIIRPPGYLLKKEHPKIIIQDCLCESGGYQLISVGQIKGHLWDNDGSPIPNVPVHLLPIATWKSERINESKLKSYHLKEVTTNENGEYKFEDINAEDYLLGISLTGVTPTSPFNRKFYPQTPHASQAKILSLKRGEILSGYDFHLKQEYETFSISGDVFWGDGTPAKKANIQLNQPINFYVNYNDDRAEVGTDEQGKFLIKGIKGHQYKLIAEWHHEKEVGTIYDFGYARSGELTVILNENQQGLRLVFPNPAPKILITNQVNKADEPTQTISRWQKYRWGGITLFAIVFLFTIWRGMKSWKRNKS